MHNKKHNNNNQYQSEEFSHKITEINNTYINKLISSIKVSVPEYNVNVDRFHIDTYDIELPLTNLNMNNNPNLKMRNIHLPDYSEIDYVYSVKVPDNIYPFSSNDPKRSNGENDYRNKTLKPINQLERIDVILDEKINMKKW